MKAILIRTSLIVAITAGVTVSAVHVTQLKNKMERLRVGLAQQTAAREKAEAEFASAQQETKKTALALKQTAEVLEARTAEVASQTEQIAKINDESKKLREERNEARQKLAAYEFSMTPEQVANAAKRNKSLEDSLAAMNEENALLGRRIKSLQKFLLGEVCTIHLPPDLNTKVLAVDPKWRFVVLDSGEDQGVFEHGELLVSRGGKLVARVQISRVEKNRCIANVMDGWNLAELMEGDRAFPAPNS
jgi:flagellar biosynthesis GTPase FlhF